MLRSNTVDKDRYDLRGFYIVRSPRRSCHLRLAGSNPWGCTTLDMDWFLDTCKWILDFRVIQDMSLYLLEEDELVSLT